MKYALISLFFLLVVLAGCRNDESPSGPFYFNLDSFPPEYRQSFQNARNWWASDPEYTDQFADSPDDGNTIFVVFSDSISSDIAALLLGNIIAFNSSKHWSDCSGKFDGIKHSIFLVSSHESGHVLGFDHTDNRNSIMYNRQYLCAHEQSFDYELP